MLHLRTWKGGINHLPQEPIASAISLALGEILAIAGGIYLSLVMLVSFLDLSVPEKIYLGNVSCEPLAFIALVLALIQPFLTQLFLRRRG